MSNGDRHGPQRNQPFKRQETLFPSNIIPLLIVPFRYGNILATSTNEF